MHLRQSTGGAAAQPSSNLTTERAAETSHQTRPAALWRGFVPPQQQAFAGLGGVQTELPGADRHRVEPEPEEPARFAGPVRSPDARQVGLLDGAPSNPEKHRSHRSPEAPILGFLDRGAPKPGGSGGSEAPPAGAPRSWRTPRPHPIQRCLPWDPRDAGKLVAAGVDLVDLAEETGARERAQALAWVGGPEPLKTRTGKSRAARIQYCGSLHVARAESLGGNPWVVQPVSCKDRACPVCMRMRARRLSSLLRVHVEPILESSHVDFVTLTSIKLELEQEDAEQAAARRFAAWSELMSKRTAGGRMLREFYRSGLRAFEQVISHRGQRRRDGTVVAYSGWHAHIHALMELAPVSSEGASSAVAFLERQARARPSPELAGLLALALRVQARLLEGRPELAAVSWSELAREFLLWRWLDLNPEASRAAQCIEPADLHRCGQLTKYLTKPFELRSPSLARELFMALEGRRCLQGFGSWLSWVKEAEKIAEEQDDDGPGVRASLTTLAEVFSCIERGDRRVVVRFYDHEVAIDPNDVVAGIKACRGSYRTAVRRQGLAEADAPTKDRFARRYLETSVELLACGAIGPPRGSYVGKSANMLSEGAG